VVALDEPVFGNWVNIGLTLGISREGEHFNRTILGKNKNKSTKLAVITRNYTIFL